MKLTRQSFRMFTLLCTAGLGFYCGHEPQDPPVQSSSSALTNGEAIAPPRAELVESIYSQQQKLVASDKASTDYLGRSVAVSADGNTAVVGAWNKSDGSLWNDGAVYIFARTGTTWIEQQKLSADDAAAGDHFGIAVAISADGKTVLVGADGRDEGSLYSNGASYVFSRSISTWTQQAKFLASDAGSADGFGGAVALSSDGNTAIVGAPNKAVSAIPGVGGAYVFTRSGGTWSEQEELLASDMASPDRFGGAVALSSDGNTAIVGADGKSDDLFLSNGAAYVFARSSGAWSEQKKFLASDRGSGHNFGKSVSLSGDGNLALVGAYKKDTDGWGQSGGAYIFSRSGGTWSERQILAESDSYYSDRFGYSVSLSSDGNSALVGSYMNSAGGLTKSGAAYLFARSGTNFVEQQKILSADRAASEFFGVSVSLSRDGTTAFIGADSKSDGSTTKNGAAYAFVTAPAKSDGSACGDARECASGFCADGVCCNTACGGGISGDCQACSKATGAANDGVCGAVAAGAICRRASGSCDVGESCDGTSTACPPDNFRTAGTICRESVGTCDAAETCSGVSADCPDNAYKPSGTVCRAAAGACDAAETCSGLSAQCPSDVLATAGTVCRPAAGNCDVAETCSGTSAACPSDTLTAAGTICRAAEGACDVAETCSGTSAACPANAFKSASTTCRAAAGPCDAAEKCSGSAATCPADKFKTNTTVCRASAGPCDIAEFCSGSAAACPADQLKPLLVVCRPSVGACDLADYCTGGSPACPPDDLQPAGTICRPSNNACDLDEVCSGSTASCPSDSHLPDGTICSGGTCKSGICM